MSIDGQRDGVWVYDEAEADRVVGFFEAFLVHTKVAPFAGNPFILDDWQRAIVAPAFGWKHHETRLRRYRYVWVEIPRKNGKSTLGAGFALWLLIEGEPGADVISAAGSAKQARLIFNQAKEMVQASRALSSLLKPYRDSILYQPASGGLCTYQVASAEAGLQHGLNPHGIVFDEIHVQPNGDLWSALEKGMAARRQPMMASFTTAGKMESGFAYERHVDALRIAKDPSIDERQLSVIYAADPEDADRFDDPKVWAKANPSLGITIPLEYMQTMSDRAKRLPSERIEFLVYHLNIWMQGAEAWIDLRSWDALHESFDLEDMVGRDCYVAVDMSKRRDISAVALAFPPTPKERESGYDRTRIHYELWVPEDGLDEREAKDNQPYRAYIADGWLNKVPGEIIDQGRIERFIADEVGKTYNVIEVAIDPYQANRLRQILEDDGMTAFEHSQRASVMSEPTKAFEEAVMNSKIAHNGNPLVRWMMGNVRLVMDSNENVRPDKKKSTGRIDGPVAAIMAYGRYAVQTDGAEYTPDDFIEL